jgi:hypothetical protein
MIKLEDNTIEVENKNYNGTYITLDDLEKVNKKVGADINNISSKIDNYVLSDIFNADMQEMLKGRRKMVFRKKEDDVGQTCSRVTEKE